MFMFKRMFEVLYLCGIVYLDGLLPLIGLGSMCALGIHGRLLSKIHCSLSLLNSFECLKFLVLTSIRVNALSNDISKHQF